MAVTVRMQPAVLISIDKKAVSFQALGPQDVKENFREEERGFG